LRGEHGGDVFCYNRWEVRGAERTESKARFARILEIMKNGGFLKRSRPGIMGGAIVFFLISASSAGGGGEGPASVKELTRLLAELRELRKQEAKDLSEWSREEEELKLLLEARRKRLERAEAKRKSARRRVESANELLGKRRRERESLKRRAAKLRSTVRGSAARLKAILKREPLLTDSKTRERIVGLSVRGEAPLSETAARFWNSLLKVALDSVRVRLERAEIVLAGKSREVKVLRLGGTGAVFLSLQEDMCGIPEVRGNEIVWRVLPSRYLEAVRKTFRVAHKDDPAAIVTVPFPRSRLVGEGGEK